MQSTKGNKCVTSRDPKTSVTVGQSD